MLNRPSFRKHVEAATLRSQALEQYFETAAVRKLQLGTGTNAREGWFNTDLEPQLPTIYLLDVTKPFPIAGTSFDFIFAEHQIEHVSYPDGCFMLRECFRLLKPGGVLRIATPNLATLLGLYAEHRSEVQQKYIRFITDLFLPGVKTYHPTFVVNNAFHNWGHRFLYDEAVLKAAMAEAGFVELTRTVPGQSGVPQLRDLEMHGQFIGDEEMSSFETMVLEGTKPESSPSEVGALEPRNG